MEKRSLSVDIAKGFYSIGTYQFLISSWTISKY